MEAGSVPSPLAGRDTGANPTDRGKLGTKHHRLADRNGLPLAMALSGANTHDSQVFIPLFDAAPAIMGKRGWPHCCPCKLHADKGYNYRFCRAYLRRRGVVRRIARRGTESKERLGRQHPWVAEPTTAWLHPFRRPRIRYDKRSAIHLAFLRLDHRVTFCKTVLSLTHIAHD